MRTLKFRARWRDTGKVVSDFMEEYTIDALNDDTFISEQFTGLLDKNGKEIYEGDIVQVSMIRGHYVCEVVDSKNIGSKSIGEVYYSACHYAVKFPEGYFDLIDLMSDQEKMNCKVIGNIHENPDLLK